MDKKLNLSDFSRAADRRQKTYYDRLPPERKKDFAFPVSLRHMSAVSGDPDIRDWYILAVNERANADHEPLWDYPDLQYRLLASCGIGTAENHLWIPMAQKRGKMGPLRDFLSDVFPGSNDAEINIVLSQIDEISLTSLLNENGLDEKEMKDILEDYAKYTGTKQKKRNRSK